MLQPSAGYGEFVNVHICVFVCVLSNVLLTEAAVVRWCPLFISGTDKLASARMEPVQMLYWLNYKRHSEPVRFSFGFGLSMEFNFCLCFAPAAQQ